MSYAAHLAKRFFGSLWPGGLSGEDAAWAAEQLLPAERKLWSSMSDADQRHGVGVARRVAATLGSHVGRPVLAAALLHDVGKTASGLGTIGRTMATLVGLVSPGHVQVWRASVGVRRRIALYLCHPELGASQLARAGSDPLTVAWACEHHMPESAWSVPWEVGNALRAADQR
jgi:hypothetical protein